MKKLTLLSSLKDIKSFLKKYLGGSVAIFVGMLVALFLIDGLAEWLIWPSTIIAIGGFLFNFWKGEEIIPKWIFLGCTAVSLASFAVEFVVGTLIAVVAFIVLFQLHSWIRKLFGK